MNLDLKKLMAGVFLSWDKSPLKYVFFLLKKKK